MFDNTPGQEPQPELQPMPVPDSTYTTTVNERGVVCLVITVSNITVLQALALSQTVAHDLYANMGN